MKYTIEIIDLPQFSKNLLVIYKSIEPCILYTMEMRFDNLHVKQNNTERKAKSLQNKKFQFTIIALLACFFLLVILLLAEKPKNQSGYAKKKYVS